MLSSIRIVIWSPGPPADYETMAFGVVAISEPAFWAGYDRTRRGSLIITGSDGDRAQAGGAVRHSTLLLDLPESQEAEDLARRRKFWRRFRNF